MPSFCDPQTTPLLQSLPPTSPPLLLPSFYSILFPPFSLQASDSGLMILGATLLLTPSAIASVGVLIIALIVPMQRAIYAVDQADALTQVATSLPLQSTCVFHCHVDSMLF